MVPIALGLLVASVYGSGDFLGGLAARSLSAARVVLWSQLAGLLALVALIPVFGGDPIRSDLTTGAAAGACGLVGVVLLYRGLAVGRMAVVAPITAVGAALVPFVAGGLRGEDVTLLRVLGAIAALGGVVLVSLPAEEPGVAGDMAAEPAAAGSAADVRAPNPFVEAALATTAGLAFGIVFVLLAEVRPEAGVWPVVVQRCTSVPLCALALAVTARSQLRPPLAQMRLLIPAGFCDAGANGLFLVAVGTGDLSIVGVVSSLYPAGTIVLAALVLHERIARVQAVGLALAGAGVVLLAL